MRRSSRLAAPRAIAVLAAVFFALPALPARALQEKGSPPAPGSAPCAVCSVREKAGPEPVAATLAYKGTTYSFCAEACKEEFQLHPEKWIRAAAPARTHEHREEPPTGGAAAPS